MVMEGRDTQCTSYCEKMCDILYYDDAMTLSGVDIITSARRHSTTSNMRATAMAGQNFVMKRPLHSIARDMPQRHQKSKRMVSTREVVST